MFHTRPPNFEKHIQYVKMWTCATPTLTLELIIGIGDVVIFHFSGAFWWL
jgi:hypothetical protein